MIYFLMVMVTVFFTPPDTYVITYFPGFVNPSALVSKMPAEFAVKAGSLTGLPSMTTDEVTFAPGLNPASETSTGLASVAVNVTFVSVALTVSFCGALKVPMLRVPLLKTGFKTGGYVAAIAGETTDKESAAVAPRMTTDARFFLMAIR